MTMGDLSIAAQRQQFSSLIEGEYDCDFPKRGEVCRATVLLVSENEILVDLGAKRDGLVPPTDLDQLDETFLDDLAVGEVVPVVVLGKVGRDGEPLVSITQGLAQQDWLRAEDLLEQQEICESEVVEVNRGGVVVQFGLLRGFVPNSQLSSVRPGTRGERLRREKEALIGQKLSLAVIEVNQRRRRLVFSQRDADWRKGHKLLAELTEGEVRTGIVRNLVDFGAFVDLGGLDGLIHISELDWKHVDHPRDVLSVGDEIEVYVLSVDRDRKRVGLSRKRLIPDPWPQVVAGLSIGQVVDGVITGIVDFGAFVDVGQGVEGLVHVSAIPGKAEGLAHLTQGAPVGVRIREIDRWKRRISLELAANPAPSTPDGGEE